MTFQFGSFHRISGLTLTAGLLALSAPALQAQNQIFDARSLAPFVPTPERVVQRMLELAEVSKDDVVYDLGSGDGRILFAAAEGFKARAVGIEINATLVEQTRERVTELGLEERIQVRQEHLLEADLSAASVVTVYLLSSSNEVLRPKLERELKPGSRVVSLDFQFRDWRPAGTADVEGETRSHRIFIYRKPICAICVDEDEVIDEIITTVVHEVAHHFGIDDDRLHELGWG